ncbi:MAG: tRNA (adenosine(37)-N6)-threonylcarbamoyltransferase complex dimerization subunit type 1 TsaB [Hyphomicrobiales bacterium]
MIVLALDTSMAGCSVALYDAAQARLIADRFSFVQKGHADLIAPLVRELMNEAGLTFPELGCIGVTVGPGSFTGVRTGLAMARGLGLALGIPVVGLDTLSAIACNTVDRGASLVVAADARRSQVYYASFGPGLRLEDGPVVLGLDEALMRLPKSEAAILGTGADALIEASSRSDLIRLQRGDLPRAGAFAGRIAEMEPRGDPPEPLYLRPPDARPQERLIPGRRDFNIEYAGPEAAALFAAMHAECFDNPWSTADMARLMGMPGAVALFASRKEEPCAFLLARQAADEAEIIAIGTRPFARRQGAAALLIDGLVSRMAECGARSLFIEAGCGNEAAQALYRRSGFETKGVRRGYYQRPGGELEDALVMRKVLLT